MSAKNQVANKSLKQIIKEMSKGTDLLGMINEQEKTKHKANKRENFFN